MLRAGAVSGKPVWRLWGAPGEREQAQTKVASGLRQVGGLKDTTVTDLEVD